MEKIDTNSWEDFLNKLEKTMSTYSTHDLAGNKFENEILFRGQSNSEWNLLTTLERQSSYSWNLQDYILLARSSAIQIDSFEKTGLHLLNEEDIKKEFSRDYGKGFIHNIPFSEWLIYLRHHGFPSPLMDWTTSVYLAAFFAFIDEPHSDYSSIFIYVGTPNGVKVGSDNDININDIGPHVRTHKRHFLQKSRYTIATKYEQFEQDHAIVSHEDIFSAGNKNQDVLIKFLIPNSERYKVLNLLNGSYNINPFSIYQTTDSLVQTIGLERIILKNSI